MLRKYFYPAFLSLFVLLVGLIVIFGKKKPDMPELKNRNAIISSTSEWLNTKEAIEGLLITLRKDPGNNAARLNLALAYIQEARITGDHTYYDNAALDLLEEVLKKEPENVDALCGKASVYLSAHQFAEAIPVAQKAIKLDSHKAFSYGLLVDAYVELGEYEKAVETTDKMVSVRPDIRSYSRVSYLREIHGEYAGAIEAMDMAVKAGMPGLEQTAWARVNLGQLYEHTGKLAEAENQYLMALEERPNYAYALAGLGRVEKAKGNYKQALQHLEKAGQSINELSFISEMAEVYSLSRQTEKATAANNKVIEAIKNTHVSGGKLQHFADLELAEAYVQNGEYDLARKHALAEHKRRPKNIDVNHLIAWVAYKKGNYKEAGQYMETALRTHSQNPTLVYRAGLIQLKSGNKEKGIALMQQALSTNPFLSPDLKAEGQNYLAIK
ncbi:tetratricopeptide repeat protein [Rhodocytophaga rosea]|uniref:Tetratricopeptide repeat protein n=1 Tax=Rhodocytophaga rosea TaxID=2704465 RepID=A0A6C0GMY2_9BACT|nr:tetratricopeptide repeat protein [Rhodocytophaga rosea]QHT69297.1 tetratricopeptide repeat protein [Rhodocytophaga rosea]